MWTLQDLNVLWLYNPRARQNITLPGMDMGGITKIRSGYVCNKEKDLTAWHYIELK